LAVRLGPSKRDGLFRAEGNTISATPAIGPAIYSISPSREDWADISTEAALGAGLFVNFHHKWGKAPGEGEESSEGAECTAPEARSKPVEQSQEQEEGKEKEGKAVEAKSALR
jgi:hypothetical protein